MTSTGEGRSVLSRNSVGALAASILEDITDNIIVDMVRNAHREEKIARMHSAAVLAEDALVLQNQTTISGDGGRASLKGNPLETTKEILCSRCRLPRLLHPTSGNSAKAPDPSVKYCDRRHFVDRPGHDIWGNPFPSDGISVTKFRKDKKEREAAAAKARAVGGLNTPVDVSDLSEDVPYLDSKPVVPTPFPNVKCSQCAQTLQVTRYAKHLEQCLGISGRQSSRNAMAKIVGSQSGSNATPQGSRLGTPLPGTKASPGKRTRDEDEDEDDATPKKKKKTLKKPADKPAKPKQPKTAGKTVPSGSAVSGKKPPNIKVAGHQGNGALSSSISSPSKLLSKTSRENTPLSPSKKAKRAGENGKGSKLNSVELTNGKNAVVGSPGALAKAVAKNSSVSPSRPAVASELNGAVKKRKWEGQTNGHALSSTEQKKKKHKPVVN